MIVLIGKIVAFIGLFITIVGLLFGFGLMFQGGNDVLATFFLMSIPVGFVVLFAGFSTVIMFSPRETELILTQEKKSKD
ncbi:MAG: hypothetical protein KAG20_05225 [Cocleimonas sp.]|nr:hypothetical protein [Cocleimonas sp.]